MYRVCLEMVADQPPSSHSPSMAKDLEGGIHLGIGGFNLVGVPQWICCQANRRQTAALFQSLISLVNTLIQTFVVLALFFFTFKVLSLLPPIIIKLLEWVGFSGDRVCINCVTLNSLWIGRRGKSVYSGICCHFHAVVRTRSLT